VDGKLEGQVSINAVEPGKLLRLSCQLTGRRFLVDTGAAYSIVPHRSGRPPCGPRLTGPGGKRILCWGEKSLNISFSNRRFKWNFLLADVQFPILGADFLQHHQLLVDLHSRQLVDVKSTLPLKDTTTTATVTKCASPLIAAVQATPARYRQLFAEFPGMAPTGEQCPPAANGVRHRIETDSMPVTARFRRLDPDKLKAAKAEFDKMEKAGIVRRSDSSWSSPLHMVMKPDGTWRPCGDYRRVNLLTRPDKYPVPCMSDFSAGLHGKTVFSKLDLKKGYYQVLMGEDDICKTAIITPFGMYEFLRMPFGLRNAGQTFQRLMDQVMNGLEYCFVYLDDILVASTSKKNICITYER